MLETNFHADGIVELRLARAPVNALNPSLIAELGKALSEHGGSARALVLSGRPGMFTAGLDVPALLALDRAQMATLWRDFLILMRTLAHAPVPVVCAITGHSPAGGAVMAVFCDARVMAHGEFSIGLNEVAVGLPVPPMVVDAYARLVGPGRAERDLAVARLMTPEEALAAGLVDELAAPQDVVPRAIARAAALAAMPANAQRETRRYCRCELLARFDELMPHLPARMTEVWFSDETQAAMKALVARIGRKGQA
jgi:3,2-trans-enoyl-CoA isomerase